MTTFKKATIKDVATRANVSISVVSNILNNTAHKSFSSSTRERVLEAAKDLGYVPNRLASRMRTQHSLSVGIVSYWKYEPLFLQFLEGVCKYLHSKNYNALLCNTPNSQDEFFYLDYYRDKRIDGILFISPYESAGKINEIEHIQQMKKSGVPFVIINGHTNEPLVSYINIDFYNSTALATEHLIQQGHKVITYVAPLFLDQYEMDQRRQGYADTMKKHGLDDLYCDKMEIPNKINDFKAVVTNKSDTAQVILTEALKRGIAIPDDFSIIAGNTEPYSMYLYPPLSTISIPTVEMGELSAKTLLDHISGTKVASTVVLPCSLHIRQSN